LCGKRHGQRWGKPFGKGSTFIFGGEVLETNQINLFVFNIYGFDIIYLSFLFLFHMCFSIFITYHYRRGTTEIMNNNDIFKQWLATLGVTDQQIAC